MQEILTPRGKTPAITTSLRLPVSDYAAAQAAAAAKGVPLARLLAQFIQAKLNEQSEGQNDKVTTNR